MAIRTVPVPVAATGQPRSGRSREAEFATASQTGKQLAAFREQLAKTVALDRERTIADSGSELALSVAQYKLDMDKNPDPDAALLEFTQRAGAEAERIAAKIGETDAELAQAFASDAIGIVTVGSIDASVYNEGRKKSIRLAKLQDDELVAFDAADGAATREMAQLIIQAHEAKIQASLDFGDAEQKQAHLENFLNRTDMDHLAREIERNPHRVIREINDSEKYPYLFPRQQIDGGRSALAAISRQYSNDRERFALNQRKTQQAISQQIALFTATDGQEGSIPTVLEIRSDASLGLDAQNALVRIANQASSGSDTNLVDYDLQTDIFSDIRSLDIPSRDELDNVIDMFLGNGIPPSGPYGPDAYYKAFNTVHGAEFQRYASAWKTHIEATASAYGAANLFMATPAGKEAIADYEIFLQPLWDERIAAGKNPVDLITEGHPDSVLLTRNQMAPGLKPGDAVEHGVGWMRDETERQGRLSVAGKGVETAQDAVEKLKLLFTDTKAEFGSAMAEAQVLIPKIEAAASQTRGVTNIPLHPAFVEAREMIQLLHEAISAEAADVETQAENLETLTGTIVQDRTNGIGKHLERISVMTEALDALLDNNLYFLPVVGTARSGPRGTRALEQELLHAKDALQGIRRLGWREQVRAQIGRGVPVWAGGGAGEKLTPEELLAQPESEE